MIDTYTIREFESFSKKSDSLGCRFLPELVFDKLEKFILENRKNDDDGNVWEFMTISLKKGEKVISAKNYVGLIAMDDGTTIEILPKLDTLDDKQTKIVFRDMLCSVRDLPFKSLNQANVIIDRIGLFEIFIRMFLQEVGKLIRMGLKSGYVNVENNERFLKGKLDFNKNIKLNGFHKERFYVQYDSFGIDRSENRLIKSTLLYVFKKTRDNENLRDCKMYLAFFSDVNESTDIIGDFFKCENNRNMREYTLVLQWCKVFLLNNGFNIFKGDEVAFALLFPMEKLFESYVANKIKKHLDKNKYSVSLQEGKKYLFDEPKKFLIKPDIVIRDKNNAQIIIMDTKWKLLSHDKHNYGITQSDMYQMYIYQKKYDAKRVLLIYPFNENIKEIPMSLKYIAYDNSQVDISVFFFNLADQQTSIRYLIEYYL